jgi:hypothetical protein
VQIHTVDGPAPTTLAGWGPPTASADDIRGDISLPLDQVQATSVLIWITDLGDAPNPHVAITEVGISAQ